MIWITCWSGDTHIVYLPNCYPQIRSSAWWIATTHISWRPGCWEVPMGGRIHYEWSQAHGEGLPLVFVQCRILPPFPQVSFHQWPYDNIEIGVQVYSFGFEIRCVGILHWCYIFRTASNWYVVFYIQVLDINKLVWQGKLHLTSTRLMILIHQTLGFDLLQRCIL